MMSRPQGARAKRGNSPSTFAVTSGETSSSKPPRTAVERLAKSSPAHPRGSCSRDAAPSDRRDARTRPTAAADRRSSGRARDAGLRSRSSPVRRFMSTTPLSAQRLQPFRIGLAVVDQNVKARAAQARSDWPPGHRSRSETRANRPPFPRFSSRLRSRRTRPVATV